MFDIRCFLTSYIDARSSSAFRSFGLSNTNQHFKQVSAFKMFPYPQENNILMSFDAHLSELYHGYVYVVKQHQLLPNRHANSNSQSPEKRQSPETYRRLNKERHKCEYDKAGKLSGGMPCEW